MFSNDVFDAVNERISNFSNKIAQAIRDGDWSSLFWNIALALAVLLATVVVVVVLAGLVITLLVKILGTLLGKIFAAPMLLLIVMFIIGKVYTLFFENSKKKKKDEPTSWVEWAENVYDYVRDAAFLAFRSVSDCCNIIKPARASAIEADIPFTIEDGYAIFYFIARICGSLNVEQFGKDVQKTLEQMHRAHELNGFSADLTEINGSYYCPLQVLGTPQDFGDYVQVSIVFATEKTVSLTMMRKVLNFDKTGRNRGPRGADLTDDEI